jgi:hypothetical protein
MMKRRHFILAISIVVILLSAFFITCGQNAPPINEDADLVGAINVEDEHDIMTTSSGVKYIVDSSKIVGGGPPRDGIPSIDSPDYVSLTEADEWIQDDELVLGIIYKGVKRVYPLQILVWHEIVNDTIAGDPLLVTY